MEKVKYHSDMMGKLRKSFFSFGFFFNVVCILLCVVHIYASSSRAYEKGLVFLGARGQKCPFEESEMGFLSYNHHRHPKQSMSGRHSSILK